MLVRIVPAFASALACAAAVAVPAPASPLSAYQAVLHVYEQRGAIAPCQFSPAQLQSALKGIDAYGAQYFADFTQAIQNALSVRASGSCSAAGSPTGGGPTGGAGRGPSVAVGPPVHLGPVTAATSAGVPAPLALMGALVAAAALSGAAVAAVRARSAARNR